MQAYSFAVSNIPLAPWGEDAQRAGEGLFIEFVIMIDKWKDQGYIDEPVDEGLDLKAEIRRMCEEKKAVVLAHYYTVGEIQEVADFVGDSLALARKAAETDAKIIVMCGVHFMAETCKLLSPDKLVLSPDLNAGCSLADSCSAADLKKWKDEHPGLCSMSIQRLQQKHIPMLW